MLLQMSAGRQEIMASCGYKGTQSAKNHTARSESRYDILLGAGMSNLVVPVPNCKTVWDAY